MRCDPEVYGIIHKCFIQVYVGSDPEVFVWYGMRYEQVCVRYDPSECEVIDPSVWYDIGYKRFDLEDKSLFSESLKFVCVVSISRYFVKKKRINCEIII